MHPFCHLRFSCLSHLFSSDCILLQFLSSFFHICSLFDNCWQHFRVLIYSHLFVFLPFINFPFAFVTTADFMTLRGVTKSGASLTSSPSSSFLTVDYLCTSAFFCAVASSMQSPFVFRAFIAFASLGFLSLILEQHNVIHQQLSLGSVLIHMQNK